MMVPVGVHSEGHVAVHGLEAAATTSHHAVLAGLKAGQIEAVNTTQECGMEDLVKLKAKRVGTFKRRSRLDRLKSDPMVDGSAGLGLKVGNREKKRELENDQASEHDQQKKKGKMGEMGDEGPHCLDAGLPGQLRRSQ